MDWGLTLSSTTLRKSLVLPPPPPKPCRKPLVPLPPSRRKHSVLPVLPTPPRRKLLLPLQPPPPPAAAAAQGSQEPCRLPFRLRGVAERGPRERSEQFCGKWEETGKGCWEWRKGVLGKLLSTAGRMVLQRKMPARPPTGTEKTQVACPRLLGSRTPRGVHRG